MNIKKLKLDHKIKNMEKKQNQFFKILIYLHIVGSTTMVQDTVTAYSCPSPGV